MAGEKAGNANNKTWIVRDREGKIYGPFNTEQVLVQIDRGYFMGGEDVALYPGGKWIPISNAPEFYDRLLEALAQEGAEKAAEKTAEKGGRKGVDRGDRSQHNVSAMSQHQPSQAQSQAHQQSRTAATGATPAGGAGGNSLIVTQPAAGIEVQSGLPAVANNRPEVPAVI